MRTIAVRLAFGLLLLGVASVSGSRDRATASALLQEPLAVQADEARGTTGSILIKAEYYSFRGPCYRVANGGLAMPVCDGFRVVEVVRGSLKIEHLDVEHGTAHGANYPQDLERGKVVLLRFTPSPETRNRMRAYERDGRTAMRITGEELQIAERDDRTRH